jgi:hypothetical protein
MPEEPQHIDGAYVGEIPWAAAAALEETWNTPWRAPRWPRRLRVTPSFESYVWEAGVRDRTLEQSIRADVPSRLLYDEGGLEWVGGRAEWQSEGRLVARFLEAEARDRDRERALFVREDWLLPLLERLGLALVWGSLGGRQILGGRHEDVRRRPEAAIDGRASLTSEWRFLPGALRLRRPKSGDWGRPRRLAIPGESPDSRD